GVRDARAPPSESLLECRHTTAAIERSTGAATTRGESRAKQQGDLYRAAGAAGGAGPAATGACCRSPLDLWRETLHEREATYMAESRDEERREEDVAGGGYQEVALRLMTALATGRSERMILDVGNAPA